MKIHDEVLLEAAKKLDEDAIIAIFDRFSPALYKFALRSSRMPDIAESILGEVFEQFIEQLATDRAPKENLRVHLYKIAYPLLLDQARANPQGALVEQTVLYEHDEPLAHTSIPPEERVLIQALISAFNTELTYEQRHVIILRFLEGFGIQETSLIIGKSVRGAKAIQNRAIVKLRKVLGLDLLGGLTNNVPTSILSSTLSAIASLRPGGKTHHLEKYEPKETRVYVENLPNGMGHDKLLRLFSKAGKVKSVHFFEDPSRRSGGSAQVVMSTLEEAIHTMYLYHRKHYDGRLLAVSIGQRQQEYESWQVPTADISLDRRRLRVFLCHAHKDAAAVRGIYGLLVANSVDAWLDKEKLLPGSDWEHEIREAVRASDIVIVCLSRGFDQRGFRQKEVRIALEESALQPQGEIFIIPARLEECDVLPSLRHLHWVNLFEPDGPEKLMLTLEVRAQKIGATLR